VYVSSQTIVVLAARGAPNARRPRNNRRATKLSEKPTKSLRNIAVLTALSRKIFDQRRARLRPSP
jgi:hypothetical protein